ncbi:transmembrane channel-like protein 5 [Denticeps clupeoides]|uniref:transmembrane channel-like protein 5 n=1 Tax=Denticeps clupeoides TaxID=299321 RepID=UPI0010A551D1|nr:transmembrane channel-like protein 5 [Denticeps clupeoides]
MYLGYEDDIPMFSLPPQPTQWQHGPVGNWAHDDVTGSNTMAINNAHMAQTRNLHWNTNYLSRHLGNLGLTEGEIRAEMENDMKELVADLGKMPIRARTQAIRTLPMSIDDKRTVRDQVLEGPPVKKSIKYCCTDCWAPILLSFSRCHSSMATYRTLVVLWLGSLKEIQAKFGTAVLSYFLFLKWLLMFNFFSFLVNLSFIAVPQLVHGLNRTSSVSFRGLELLTGAGYFNQTVLFYGGYNGGVIETQLEYNMQLAYFFTIVTYLALCGILLIYSMARSFQRNVVELGSVTGTVSLLFCSWDFSVSDIKAIQSHKARLHVQLMESLAGRKQTAVLSRSDRTKHFSLHLVSWLLSLVLTAGSCAAVHFLCQVNLKEIEDVQASGELVSEAATLLLPVVVTLIILVVPILFSLINKMDPFPSPRSVVYITMLRNVLLRMSVLGILCYYWLTQVPNKIPCWESFVGQDVYRLIVMDFLLSALGFSFVRCLMNLIISRCGKSLGAPEFDIARNVLDLIYGQTLAWIGMYFSPLLPAIQIIKLFITFYMKKVTIGQNCQLSARLGQAAQMETVFIALLFFPSLVGSLALVAYTIWSLKPSLQCGPFQGLNTTFQAVSVWVDGLGSKPGGPGAVWVFRNVIQSTVFFFLSSMAVIILQYFFWQAILGQKQHIGSLRKQIVSEAKDKAFLLEKLRDVQAARARLYFNPQNDVVGHGSVIDKEQQYADTWSFRESVQSRTFHQRPKFQHN